MAGATDGRFKPPSRPGLFAYRTCVESDPAGGCARPADPARGPLILGARRRAESRAGAAPRRTPAASVAGAIRADIDDEGFDSGHEASSGSSAQDGPCGIGDALTDLEQKCPAADHDRSCCAMFTAASMVAPD